jgi:hypothetical protein
MRWQQTYKHWLQGRTVYHLLPRATFYRHRASILRVYGVDIKNPNFDLFPQQPEQVK